MHHIKLSKQSFAHLKSPYIDICSQPYTGLILHSQETQVVQEICIERDECTVGLELIHFFTKY